MGGTFVGTVVLCLFGSISNHGCSIAFELMLGVYLIIFVGFGMQLCLIDSVYGMLAGIFPFIFVGNNAPLFSPTREERILRGYSNVQIVSKLLVKPYQKSY
jgi:hypothetical protein